jgi:CRISPR-associated exonuclease Cas4
VGELEAVQIAGLQHWSYCPRQCALIHIEQAFDEDLHTLRGHALHSRVDVTGSHVTKGTRGEQGLPLWNDEIGLIGKADVVEFDQSGAAYPVEYKSGNRNKSPDIGSCDDIQLAAQAMCLEFMTGKAVLEGAIFYGESKRRRIVRVVDELRSRVLRAATQVREMLSSKAIPPPLSGLDARRRCKGCSLIDRCQPQANAAALRAARVRLFDPDA